MGEGVPRLLRCIDEIVRLDEGAPGFFGLVSIAVNDGTERLPTWNARFDATGVRTVFTGGIVDDATVVLVLDAEDADALLAEDHAAVGMRTIYGQRQHLDAMVRRYFVSVSGLDVRLQALAGARPTRRRRRR